MSSLPVRSRLTRPAQYLALAGYLVFLGFPLLWMLSTSLKQPAEIASLQPTLLPETVTFDNYRDAFTEQSLVRAAVNSTQVAVFAALLTVVLALPAAYALARYRTPLNRLALGWVLLSQLFPFILVIIPLFLVVRNVGLFDTHAGLVLVYVVWSLPFALWMLQSYVRGIPRDIEEAAAVDGAGRLRVLKDVVAPLLVPGIVATTIFAFISAWNEFFFALVLLKSPDLQTLPLVLARFSGPEGVARYGPLAAAALLATLPGLAFFALLQRRLSSGLLSGAVKS